ncbi:hypothetical protein BC830DRAFT_671 [Chytriomyces sp. MP71]|nr:hypothetical protein BC830DRAFT_671 [Chytriomyces sp. MP71]
MAESMRTLTGLILGLLETFALAFPFPFPLASSASLSAASPAASSSTPNPTTFSSVVRPARNFFRAPSLAIQPDLRRAVVIPYVFKAADTRSARSENWINTMKRKSSDNVISR